MLARLGGVTEVGTAVGARKAIVAYDAERVTPAAIRETIHGLGMTVMEAHAPAVPRRRSLPDLLGWACVTVVALMTLVGIAGERTPLLRELSWTWSALPSSVVLCSWCYVWSVDPLAGSAWSAPATVAGFAQSAPNAVLLRFAEHERRRWGSARALDLGCGAGRNAIPLASLGWDVVGLDLSWPMLCAAAPRVQENRAGHRLHLVLAPMDQLPVRSHSFDLIIAHGIWNLARSAAEFRRALHEAARVATPDAGLFVFTFSRTTFPPETEPVAGEPFVFTQFSGQPQCFLTEAQLVTELGAAGFALDPHVPITEYNRPQPGTLHHGTAPVIYEAAFRYAG